MPVASLMPWHETGSDTPPSGGVIRTRYGLADIAVMRERTLEVRLSEDTAPAIEAALDGLASASLAEIARQGVAADAANLSRRVHIRYDGSDSALIVDHGTNAAMVAEFEAAHGERYGFTSPENRFLSAQFRSKQPAGPAMRDIRRRPLRVRQPTRR